MCADIFNSIFATGPAVALIITLVLDNTVPGTREERGLHVWQALDTNAGDWWEDDHMNRVRSALLAPVCSCFELSSGACALGTAACNKISCHEALHGVALLIWTFGSLLPRNSCMQENQLS